MAQTVKRLSTMRETQVWTLGWEDPLEKEIAIHSSTIAWKIPWTEEPGRLQSMGSQRVGHNWGISLSLSFPNKKKKNSYHLQRAYKTLESPLDCKEIQPVHPKGNQSWIFIGRTDAEAETPILWLPDAKNQLIGKDPDVGKDWRQEEKGTTEDEMVGWHHRLSGHEFKQALGDGDGQGSLACCSPWGCKELDTTKRLNSTVF